MTVAPPARSAARQVLDRSLTKPVTHIRSTLIMSSQATLRAEGLFDRYLSLLAADERDEITQLAAPAWLPMRVGLAHYEACDALRLSDARVVTMAQRVGAQRNGTFLGVAINLARGVGVTPLTIFGQAPRIWSRAFVGGGISGAANGPKDLRIEVTGWPFARIGYCRHALCGICLGVAKLIASDADVRLLDSPSEDDLWLQLSWV